MQSTYTMYLITKKREDNIDFNNAKLEKRYENICRGNILKVQNRNHNSFLCGEHRL